MITIRQAIEKDFAALPEIEMDAGYEFSKYDLSVVAEMPASPLHYYQNLPTGSSVFVAWLDEAIVGFSVCKHVDQEGHLKEVSVLRKHMKKGIGRKLIDKAVIWAKDCGFNTLTLTTYRDIKFNAPLYEKLGFVAFEPDENWPELKAIREEERASGLDVQPRICMKLSLDR